MQKVFKRNDNKLGFCQCCQWFSGVVYYFEMMGYITHGSFKIRDIIGECGLGRSGPLAIVMSLHSLVSFYGLINTLLCLII